MTLKNQEKTKLVSVSVVTVLVGWIIGFGSMTWQLSSKDSNYSLRLDRLESEIQDFDSRLDESESFRIILSTDLASIKTDLVWIRKELETLSRRP